MEASRTTGPSYVLLTVFWRTVEVYKVYRNAQNYQLAIDAKCVGRINKPLFFFSAISKIYNINRLILGSIHITLCRCPITWM